MDLQQIPFISAAVETDAPLGETDEVVLRLLQLQGLHVELFIYSASIEQELMGWDREEGFGQLPDSLLVEVLQILRSQQHGRFLFADALEAVADILNNRSAHSYIVRQPDIQLVQCRHCIALSQQLVAEIGQDIEEHGASNILTGLQESFDTEYHKAGGGHIGVAVEKLALRPLAHGVKTQQNFLQNGGGVELILSLIKIPVLLLDERVQVREDGIILRGQAAEIGAVADVPSFVKPAHHDFDNIDLAVGEALVGAEKVPQKTDVLGQPCGLTEGGGGVHVLRAAAVVPTFGFQRVDPVLSTHQIQEAPAHRLAHILLLMLHIQADGGFPGLQQIEEQELHQVTFSLAGVTQNEDVG